MNLLVIECHKSSSSFIKDENASIGPHDQIKLSMDTIKVFLIHTRLLYILACLILQGKN